MCVCVCVCVCTCARAPRACGCVHAQTAGNVWLSCFVTVEIRFDVRMNFTFLDKEWLRTGISRSSEKATSWTTEESWYYFQQKQLQNLFSLKRPDRHSSIKIH